MEDRGVVTHASQFVFFPGVEAALSKLDRAGFALVVITNQAVVARGMVTEEQLHLLHTEMTDLLIQRGAPRLTGVYACPHHPKASLIAYRTDCTCRKPRPGLILKAAEALGIQLHSSYMIGDRITDIAAGTSAGCQTVLLTTGRHMDPLIETSAAMPAGLSPDFVCDSLSEAANWIIPRS